MEVTVYGAGYVGLVSAVCLSEMGHRVCCFDIDQDKIHGLNQGQLPIYEPELTDLLHKNLSHGRVYFTADAKESVTFGELQIIAVSTPPREDGSVDLCHVWEVGQMIGRCLCKYCTIAIKSTVPVGTSQQLHRVVQTELMERHLAVDFAVVSNPEFLKEGTAVNDFMHPDRIVIGTLHERALQDMQELYAPWIARDVPWVVMDEASAEFSKYVANAFLATKISFINEMSRLADRLGADIEQVKTVLGLDKRINIQFLNPGCGFGGSCFPKDLQALKRIAEQQQCRADVIEAVLQTNEKQKRWLFEKIDDFFAGDLANKTIALWGLSFKPHTDDVRAAPSRVLMELLWQSGACVRAYDPCAMENIRMIYGESEHLTLCTSAEAALQGAHAVAIATEWDEFRHIDWPRMQHHLHYRAVFDGRNLYDPTEMQRWGLHYYPVGRGKSIWPTWVRSCRPHKIAEE